MILGEDDDGDGEVGHFFELREWRKGNVCDYFW